MALVGHWKPRGQAWQVPERVALAKVPGLQGLQAPLPEGAKKPELQARQVEAWAPEKVPAGQVLQLLEPGVLAYWPGAQAPHESWATSGLKVPTGLHRGREAGQKAAAEEVRGQCACRIAAQPGSRPTLRARHHAGHIRSKAKGVLTRL